MSPSGLTAALCTICSLKSIMAPVCVAVLLSASIKLCARYPIILHIAACRLGHLLAKQACNHDDATIAQVAMCEASVACKLWMDNSNIPQLNLAGKVDVYVVLCSAGYKWLGVLRVTQA
eukprot:scaffold176006_cov31-Prasinocladus_malaysianus.AAC.2